MDKLYFLDQDGSELRSVVVGCTHHPDGIVIDDLSGYIDWIKMKRDFKRPDGSIERAKPDGSARRPPDRYLLSSRA